ncbi:Protein argonaute 1 (translation initiation factor eIF2C 1) [Gracilaria domingensis]|nr:Protein argonaute 1 (translation initiation factor eIF2C 1) [Gracilaria domingensis]
MSNNAWKSGRLNLSAASSSRSAPPRSQPPRQNAWQTARLNPTAASSSPNAPPPSPSPQPNAWQTGRLNSTAASSSPNAPPPSPSPQQNAWQTGRLNSTAASSSRNAPPSSQPPRQNAWLTGRLNNAAASSSRNAPPTSQTPRQNVMSQNPSHTGRLNHTEESTSRNVPPRSQPPRESGAPSSAVVPMRRPAVGKLGRPVQLQSNFFRLRIPDNLRVHLYHVTFARHGYDTRRRPAEIDCTAKQPVGTNRNILECVRTKYQLFRYNPAYDGRSTLFSVEDRSRRIGGDKPYQVEVTYEGLDHTAASLQEKLHEFNVYISYIKSIDFNDLKNGKVGNVDGTNFIQSLDIALAMAPLSNPEYVQVGRCFYTDARTTPLTRSFNVASAWSGFYQSVRQTACGLHLNVDLSCTSFWDGGGIPLMSFLCKVDPQIGRVAHGSGCANAIAKLSSKFNGLKVKATHNRISYSVYGFSNRSASAETFSLDGRYVTIQEYYASQYNYALQYPNWPCAKVHKKRDIFVPIELLVVKTKQAYKGAMVGEAQGAMVRHATAVPAVVRDFAQDNIRTIGHGGNETCRSFGISVSDKLVELPGRILQTPFLQYESESYPGTAVQVRNGSWTPNANGRRLRFFRPGKVREWGILNTSKLGEYEVRRFGTELTNALRDAGLVLGHPMIRACSENDVGAMIRQMCRGRRVSEAQEQLGMSLLVVIKERQDTMCYGAIKAAGDLEVGVVTQACLARNCSRRARNMDQYISKLILKINAKLGGINCYPLGFEVAQRGTVPDPAFISNPYIVLGADVSHPTGGGPSVAALVGSVDAKAYQFAAAIHNQKGRQEIIGEMGTMFRSVYRQWYERLGCRWHANAIIMFRDGVSEGQFTEVMEREIHSIRKECSLISPEFKPKITYIIITKRHHVRFFPKDPSSGDRNGNIHPGTVVDTDITSNDFYDFYLNSHSAIRGTNKPSKYTVLLDENNIPTDVLQAYIFRLTHSYCRTNGSVSMVHAAYYAHHLAARGRLYVNKSDMDKRKNDGGKRGRGGMHRNERAGRNRETDPESRESPVIHPVHHGRLFFI